MPEENQSSGVESSFFRFGERFGLPALILFVAGYVGWNEVLRPVSQGYVKLINDVMEVNRSLTAEAKNTVARNEVSIQRLLVAVEKIETKIDRLIELRTQQRPE